MYLSRDEALEYTEHGVRLLLFLSVRLGAVSFLNSLCRVIIPLFCREVYPQVLLDQALVHLVMKPTELFVAVCRDDGAIDQVFRVSY